MKKIIFVIIFLLVPGVTSALTLEQGEFKAKLNGLELWYKVSGKGPVCLIPSPGWGVGVDYLFGLKPLEEQFTMVYLETRGTGRSERPKTTKEYTLGHFTGDLEALRKHLKQDQVWLMGHSCGGLQIMGYALSEDLAATSTITALQMALKNRKFKTTIIHHSDRGLQYCSAGYVKVLQQNNFLISMTADGNPYDNAIAERVNGILKQEFELEDTRAGFEQSRKQTRQSIELYNTLRPHLSCHMLTPKQMHQQQTLPVKTWRKKFSKSLKDLENFSPRT